MWRIGTGRPVRKRTDCSDSNSNSNSDAHSDTNYFYNTWSVCSLPSWPSRRRLASCQSVTHRNCRTAGMGGNRKEFRPSRQ